MNMGSVGLEFLSQDGLLSPDEYRLLAGPALKAAAQVAAARDNRDLFRDMASMLALLATVTALTRCYQAAGSDTPVYLSRLESVPIAVCALVFTRSGLAPSEVRDCLAALPRAYQMLVEAGVLVPEDVHMKQAYAALVAGETERADQLLAQVGHAITNTVDRWEEQRPRMATLG